MAMETTNTNQSNQSNLSRVIILSSVPILLTDQNELRCPFCGEQFTSLRAVDEHVMRVHRS